MGEERGGEMKRIGDNDKGQNRRGDKERGEETRGEETRGEERRVLCWKSWRRPETVSAPVKTTQ